MRSQLHVRVDANGEIGYGHLIRCIAISRSLKDFSAIFYSTEDLRNDLESHFESTPDFVHLKNSDAFFDFIEPSDMVLLDGYQFNLEYSRLLRNKKAKIIRIDDLAEGFIDADLIINPTPSFSTEQYQAPLYAQFYLGLEYALLRPHFLNLAKKVHLDKTSGSLLICFGGSDPKNLTASVLSTVKKKAQFNSIHVVLGPGYKYHSVIQDLADDAPNIMIHNNLSEKDMCDLMERTESAILPSSGILLEGLAAKMNIISGFYVENQKHVYAHHLKIGTFIDAKDFSEVHLNIALATINKASLEENFIDGKSIERISKAIKLLQLEKACKLVKAKFDHTKITYEWANNPEIRKYAFSNKPIPWEDHSTWFNAKINDQSCWYGILEFNGIPAGSIRFDVENKKARISYLVDPNQHGKGLGTLLIKLGLQQIEKEFNPTELNEIYGEVFPSNVASIKTFDKFGFEKTLKKDVFLFYKKFPIHV